MLQYAGIANNSTNYENYTNNTNNTEKKLNNALYAIHRLTTRKSDGAWIEWTASKTYKKGEITTIHKALSEEEQGNYEFSNNIYDRDRYNYTIYTELATGSLEDAKVKNIYDMAGNMWKWTTETGKHNSTSDGATEYAVFRGGAFNFRVVPYIK